MSVIKLWQMDINGLWRINIVRWSGNKYMYRKSMLDLDYSFCPMDLINFQVLSYNFSSDDIDFHWIFRGFLDVLTVPVISRGIKIDDASMDVTFSISRNRQRHWPPDDDGPDTVSCSHPNLIFYSVITTPEKRLAIKYSVLLGEIDLNSPMLVGRPTLELIIGIRKGYVRIYV